MLNEIFVKTQKNRSFWGAIEMLTDVKTAKFFSVGERLFFDRRKDIPKKIFLRGVGKKVYLCSVKTYFTMCEVTLKINENQVRRINPALKDIDAITRWAQHMMDTRIADLLEIRSRENLKPYTIEELHERIRESEADIAAGRTISHEEMMRQWEEELAREEKLEMVEVV